MKTRTLVDVSVIAQAAKTDGEAGWRVYGGRHRTLVKWYEAQGLQRKTPALRARLSQPRAVRRDQPPKRGKQAA